MREFKTSCIDVHTGKELILANCSYNMACDWLEKKAKQHGLCICGIGHDRKSNMTHLYTGNPTASSLNLTRKYYYDEARGVLLGD